MVYKCKKKTSDFLYMELKDDSTPYGGKSWCRENLREFLAEVELSIHAPIEKVNRVLKACGIQPLPYKKNQLGNLSTYKNKVA